MAARITKATLTMLVAILALAAALFISTDRADASDTQSTETQNTTITMPAIYQDGMVLQREVPLTVCGYSTSEGATVTVTIGDATSTATVTDGSFCAELEPMEAAVGIELTVSDGTSTLTLHDVNIGEIWYFSGQSNMNYPINQMEGYEEYLAFANDYNIRAFLVPNIASLERDEIGQGQWFDATATELSKYPTEQLSAVAYVTAARLALGLEGDVPVAVIDSSYYGTTAKCWTSPEVYAEIYGRDHTDFAVMQAYKAYFDAHGEWPTSAEDLPQYVGKHYQHVLSVCYEPMVHFLRGYSVRGAVWYQGESHIGSAYEYPDMYKGVAKTLRQTFGNDELPIFMIQLAPYSSDLSSFRAEQYSICRDDESSYLVSCGMDGTVFSDMDLMQSSVDDYFVHTARKSAVGNRTAESILLNIYGSEDITPAPDVTDIAVTDGGIVITFNTEVSLLYGDTCEGFEIRDAYGYRAADAVIDGCTVILTVENMRSPTEIRYGFGDFYLELADGTRVTPRLKFTDSYQTNIHVVVVDTANKSHFFEIDGGDVLRSGTPGNLTNASGHPLPVLCLNISDFKKEADQQ